MPSVFSVDSFSRVFAGHIGQYSGKYGIAAHIIKNNLVISIAVGMPGVMYRTTSCLSLMKSPVHQPLQTMQNLTRHHPVNPGSCFYLMTDGIIRHNRKPAG
jgi:serine phosphatase RsbU (regulator of sigma subunit)